MGTRQLVLDQDFSCLAQIDPAVWHFDDGPVYNNELQTYTSPAEKNARVEDGCLVIEARRKGGKVTSARLASRQSWKYAKVEVVAQVPRGKGTWPAIWMLGDSVRKIDPAIHREWPLCGEIDIMEHVGFDPTKFHANLHSESFNHMKQNSRAGSLELARAASGFHTFVLDWTKSGITVSMDGQQALAANATAGDEKSWPFDAPFFLILNLAIGGDWGGQQGVDESIFPAQYRIKSVRVWQ